MAILSLADYRTLTNTSSGADDAYITSLLTVAQKQIETYCDRTFDSQDYLEWYKYNRYITLRQYPVTAVKYIGEVDLVGSFNSEDYNYEWTSTALYITDNTLNTTTITFGGAIITLTDIKTAVEAAIPAITLTINSGYATLNYKLIRVGTGRDIYGCRRNDCQTKLIEDENRTLEFIMDSGFVFFTTADCITDTNVFVAYTAGYTYANMPKDLQMVVANIVTDVKASTSAGITGLLTGETITNYSWQSSTELLKNVGNELNNYTDVLDAYRKKTI